MKAWFKERFEVASDDGTEYISWIAENGKETVAPLDFVVSMFEGATCTYEGFSERVDPPTENPEVEGVTWGNHVRAWRDAGLFD